MSVTDTTDPGEQIATVSGVRIAYALFAGIFAWLAHLIGQAGLNGLVCRTGQLWPMHALTAGLLLLTLHALYVSWTIHRDTTASPSIQAARFLGWAGIVINSFNAALIIAEWVPVVFIHPCATG